MSMLEKLYSPHLSKIPGPSSAFPSQPNENKEEEWWLFPPPFPVGDNSSQLLNVSALENSLNMD